MAATPSSLHGPWSAARQVLRNLSLALAFPLVLTGCDFEAIYDLVQSSESSEAARPTVWVVEGLVHNGVTLIVDTRPGAVVTAAIERTDSSKTLFTLEATADSEGRAELTVVPEKLELGAKPKEKVRYTARIQVAGDEIEQMVHRGFSPAAITSVGIEADKSGSETLTLHIACEDRWLTHKSAGFTSVDGTYGVRMFVPEAAQIKIADETLEFRPEPRVFSGKNDDYEAKKFEIPVPTTVLSLSAEAFSSAMTVRDLRQPNADVGPRFEVTLEDGTVCNGSVARSMPTGLDIKAFLAKPAPVPLPGDGEPYGGNLAALYYEAEAGEEGMNVKVLGKGWAPPQALRYIIEVKEDARYGPLCAYKKTSTGERVNINRVARDKLITIYDRRTGKVDERIRIKAKMLGCARETYSEANLEHDVPDEKIEKRVAAWAKKHLG